MKHAGIPLVVALLLFSTFPGVAQALPAYQQVAVDRGIGLGSAIAVAISWSTHKSILWAIVHGLLGWLYVVYYYLTRTT
jgi:hypothetical protein